MLRTCPDPVDVNDIQFKLHCSLKIFDNKDVETFPNNHSLISCASRYGLLFVGSNIAVLKVVQLKIVENYTHKDKEVSNFPRRNLSLPSAPKHVCVNCDSTILAVVLQRDNCPIVIFFDVLSFYKQNITVIREVRLSATPGTYVTEVNWNPALPGIFTACKSDGTLGIYELKDTSVDINELPAAAESTSFCWSPKGKQIAVGSRNGNITQYKPDLKAVKMTNAPSFDVPHSLISLCWVSNYQFIGVYQSLEEGGQAKLIVVDAPKTGETSYTNYDDVCYSGSSRVPQFYLTLVQHWNLLMIASSNSMELGLLGAVSEVWTQWNVPDFARAELPLGPDKQDTLPLGMALDISNTKALPWGEGTIPPCPYLLLLSHQGVIYFYDIVNLKQGMPNLWCPPDDVPDTSGMAQFVVECQEPVTQSSPPQSQSTFSFGAPQQPIAQTSQPIIASLPSQVSQPNFTFSKQPAAQPALSFGMPQPSVPPNTSLFSKPTDGKPLFGNQITITPVKPQPQPTAPLFGGSVTVTPVKPQPTADTSEKYASIFAALKSSGVTPTAVEARPIVVATKPESHTPESPKVLISETSKSILPETPKTIVVPQTAKTVAPETPKTVVDPKLVIDEKVKGETQALLAKMVRDECVCLEAELKALLHQGRKIDVNIGTDNEKTVMLTELHDLQEFIKEIVDVSLGESAEIHSLKQNLILSWAWFEEALSRYNVSKDETMSLILKNQPLDSATEKRQCDIRKIIYYLDSQLSQACKALDEQWDKFQDYAKKTYKVKMPTMEAIFQAMVRQNAILQKQSYILKDINGRLKHRKVSAGAPSLFVGLNTNKIEEDLRRLQLDCDDGHRIIYEQTLDRAKKLSACKVNKLRNLVKAREVVHVTAVRPPLNQSLSKSPASRSRQIFSILGAQMSPVAKPAVVKNLQFSQSTPVHVAQEARPTAVPPNTPVQPDPSKTFTFKSLDKNVGLPPTSTFHHLSKSASLLNNLNQAQSASSAFAPTTQASKTFIFSPNVTVSAELPPIQPLSFDGSSSSKKAEPASVAITTDSTTKQLFGFGVPSSTVKWSADSAVSEKTTAEASSGFPSFGATTTPTLFSFGKTPSATLSTLKPAPLTVSSTSSPSLFATTTSQPSFSFAKTATVSPSIDTLKTATNSKIASNVSSKPNLFSTAATSLQSSSSLPPVPAKSAINTSAAVTSTKPVSFGTPASTTQTSITKPIVLVSTPSSTTSKISTPVVVGTSKSFGSVTPASIAITTQTTSLFGSISSSSVTTSLFGTKPTMSADSGVSLFEAKPAAAIDSTSSSATESSTSLPAVVSTAAVKSTAPSIVSSGSPTSTTKSIFASADTTNYPIFAVTSTVGSIFGSSVAPATSTKSMFGAAPSSTASIFSSAAASISTSNEAAVFGVSTTTSPTSIFSSNTAKSPSSIFGSAPIFGAKSAAIALSTNSTAVSTTTQPSVLSSSITPASTDSSVFSSAATNTQTSPFGKPIFDSTQTTTQASAFTSGPTTTPAASVFGTPAAATQASLFSTPPTTTQASIFGGATAVTQSSVFGTPTTTQSSVFGTPTTTQSSAFGTSTTVQPSIFSTTTTTQPAAFGTATTTQPVFGTITTTSASVFGSAGTSAQTSIFGSGSTTQQSSIFGSAPASPTGSIFSNTPGAAFGTANPTSTQGSIFGSASPVASPTSIFGTATTTSSGFGQTTGSIFGSTFGATPTTTTAFGQPAAFSATPGSIFGTPTTSSGIFGSGSSTFGVPSTSSNVFGSGSTSSFSFATAANNTSGSLSFGGLNVGSAPTTTSSIFGGGSPAFGQTPSNPFARQTTFETPAASTTGSIFGGDAQGTFGNNAPSTFGSSSFGSAGGFGQQASFGQSSFGQQSTFGGTSQTQGGPFSGGGVGVGQTGFGSSGSFQKPGGFGSAPAFGAAPQPAFGGNPSFGGAPAFGGGPAFGSPPKVFGASTPAAAFGGATTGGSPGFGNLASQNTVGFGSLAQQATQPTSAPFSGNSSFSSWR